MSSESPIANRPINLSLEYQDPWWRHMRILNLIEKLGIDLNCKNIVDLGCDHGFLEKSVYRF